LRRDTIETDHKNLGSENEGDREGYPHAPRTGWSYFGSPLQGEGKNLVLASGGGVHWGRETAALKEGGSRRRGDGEMAILLGRLRSDSTMGEGYSRSFWRRGGRIAVGGKKEFESA